MTKIDLIKYLTWFWVSIILLLITYLLPDCEGKIVLMAMLIINYLMMFLGIFVLTIQLLAQLHFDDD